MKVYLTYDGKDLNGHVVSEVGDSFKLRFDIPASWSESPCERILSFFLKTLKEKRGLDPSLGDLVMKCGGVVLKHSDVVKSCISEYNDIFVLHRPLQREEVSHEGELRCTNYGCNRYFKEDENPDDGCHYHSKGPVFHDLEKYWGCCESKKAFDWESFQAIPTCCVGKHSTINKPFVFPKEEITNRPLNTQQKMQLNSDFSALHDGKPTSGPREFDGACSSQGEPQKIVDGKARCRNFGCTKEFLVADNSATSCVYHKGAPVFWDTYKYWSCCPDKKCYEFDDFVCVPGCCVGFHKL